MRPRLLPATVAVTGLLLATKSLDLVLTLLPGRPTLQEAVVPTAFAAPATETKPAGAVPRPAASAQPASVAPSQPASPSGPPPPRVNDEEIKLLQDLRGRRQEWDKRDSVLSQREEVLQAAEQRLAARAAELEALQARLEQLEKARAQREDANWAGLVKLYETMKPRDAAAIFNDMDAPVLLEVVDRMKESKAAPIFAAMIPDRARLLTAQLAAKRSRTTAVPDAPPAAQGNAQQ